MVVTTASLIRNLYLISITDLDVLSPPPEPLSQLQKISQYIQYFSKDVIFTLAKQYLEDDDFRFRAEMCYALGRSGRADCISMLQTMLTDKNKRVRSEAQKAIVILEKKQEGHITNVFKLEDVTYPYIKKFAEATNPNEKHLYLKKITKIINYLSDEILREITIESLRTEDPYILDQLCYALSRIGRLAFIDDIQKLMSDDDNGVKEQAQRAFRAIITRSLDDPDPKIRLEACQSLQKAISRHKLLAAKFKLKLSGISAYDSDKDVQQKAKEVAEQLAIVRDRYIDLELYVAADMFGKLATLQNVSKNPDVYSKRNLEALISAALNDHEPAVRGSAIQLLNQWIQTGIWKGLRFERKVRQLAFNDPDPWICGQSAIVARKLFWPAALPVLFILLTTSILLAVVAIYLSSQSNDKLSAVQFLLDCPPLYAQSVFFEYGTENSVEALGGKDAEFASIGLASDSALILDMGTDGAIYTESGIDFIYYERPYGIGIHMDHTRILVAEDDGSGAPSAFQTVFVWGDNDPTNNGSLSPIYFPGNEEIADIPIDSVDLFEGTGIGIDIGGINGKVFRYVKIQFQPPEQAAPDDDLMTEVDAIKGRCTPQPTKTITPEPPYTLTSSPSSSPSETPEPPTHTVEVPTLTSPPTDTPLPSHTTTATQSPSATATIQPSSTATETPSQIPISTPTPSGTATKTPTGTTPPILTATRTPFLTHTPTITPLPLNTATATQSPSATATIQPSSTATETPSPIPTSTPTPSETATKTPTRTTPPILTATRTPFLTYTPTITPLPTNTATVTPNPSSTATDEPSKTPTTTLSPTNTSTTTPTPSNTGTRIPTRTPTITLSPTNTAKASQTPVITTALPPSTTATKTPYQSLTPTVTQFPAKTATLTQTINPTNFPSLTLTQTRRVILTPSSTVLKTLISTITSLTPTAPSKSSTPTRFESLTSTVLHHLTSTPTETLTAVPPFTLTPTGYKKDSPIPTHSKNTITPTTKPTFESSFVPEISPVGLTPVSTETPRPISTDQPSWASLLGFVSLLLVVICIILLILKWNVLQDIIKKVNSKIHSFPEYSCSLANFLPELNNTYNKFEESRNFLVKNALADGLTKEGLTLEGIRTHYYEEIRQTYQGQYEVKVKISIIENIINGN